MTEFAHTPCEDIRLLLRWWSSICRLVSPLGSRRSWITAIRKRSAKERSWVVVNRDPKVLDRNLEGHDWLSDEGDEETSNAEARWAPRSANMATVRGCKADWLGRDECLSRRAASFLRQTFR